MTELPEMRALVLGAEKERGFMKFQSLGAVEIEFSVDDPAGGEEIQSSCIVVPCTTSDEAEWMELVRFAHRQGCTVVPALNREHAVRVARAYLEQLAEEIGSW